MNIAIVGSRGFTDYETLKSFILLRIDLNNIYEVISGGAKGADKLGEQFAREFNLQFNEILPDWNLYGKKAGFVRNKDIIKHSDIVFAFWDGESKGTKHSIELAQEDISKITYVYKFSYVKMQTSYFSNMKNLPQDSNFISIAGKSPNWYKGREYKKLAPQYSWWKEWKENNHSPFWYRSKYYETVLNKLDPKEVIKELGENPILLCYEYPHEFCHRHIVAEWLYDYQCRVEEIILPNKKILIEKETYEELNF